MRVTIVYPADPLGTIPGGIDTWISGALRWAPDDISYSLIGATTDTRNRPVGVWKECKYGNGSFMFFPVISIENPERQSKIPVTINFLAALVARSPKHRYDLLEFHRIEPCIRFLRSKAPKVTFIHQDMEVLYNKSSDIRWRYAPWLYFKLEDLLLKRFDAVNVVNEKAVKNYQRRYPQLAERFHFVPTWMDPEIFYPADQPEKVRLREKLFEQFHIGKTQKLLVSVGRLDRQKNPIRLIDSFGIVAKDRRDVHLILIGDGVLQQKIRQRIRDNNLSGRITLLGLLSIRMVGEWLRASDLLVLSSDYEGMPICVIEAMGCGVPVATTDVGEVRKLVTPSKNGEIATNRSVDSLTMAIRACLENLDQYRGAPCLEAAAKYVPTKIFAPVYDRYRDIVGHYR